MSNERFNDELLSAIIDGEAEPELVASVNADAEASTRLEQMRQAVQIVAEEPPAATAQRRSASIAAAMAAATPAPEVTSLAAARHERAETKKQARSFSTGWVAAVAAAVAFLIAIPIAIGLGGGSGATDVAADATDSTSLNVTDAAGDAADAVAETSSDDAMEDDEAMEDAGDSARAFDDDAMEDDAMEEAMEDDEEAMEDDEAMEDEDTDFAPADEVAAESEETATPSTTTTANGLAARTDELRNLRDLTAVNNLDVLDDLIDLGTIAPKYSAADLATVREVSPECIEPRDGVSMPTPYALANLTLFGGVDRLILVEFADDGSTRVLDAEDCAPLR